MKIEIEWNCSYEAVMRIQGRECKISLQPGITSLESPTGKDAENTFGGLIARKLYGKIAKLMQAECILDDAINPDGAKDVTWKRIKNSLAEELEAEVW